MSEALKCVKFDNETFNFIAGYIDVDCSLSASAVPSVIGIVESPACCSVQCESDVCVRQNRCSQVTLQVTNATYNATCRFQVSTVRNKAYLLFSFINSLSNK